MQLVARGEGGGRRDRSEGSRTLQHTSPAVTSPTKASRQGWGAYVPARGSIVVPSRPVALQEALGLVQAGAAVQRSPTSAPREKESMADGIPILIHPGRWRRPRNRHFLYPLAGRRAVVRSWAFPPSAEFIRRRFRRGRSLRLLCSDNSGGYMLYSVQ